MILILLLIAISWFANLFTWAIDFEYWVTFREKFLDYKIFKCPKCFAFWSSLVILYMLKFSFIDVMVMSLCTSLIANMIEKHLKIFY